MDSSHRSLQQENQRLRREVQACLERIEGLESYLTLMALLHEAQRRITAQPDPMPMLDKLLGRVLQVMGTTDGSMSLLNIDKRQLVFTLVHGSVREALTGFRLSAVQGVAGWIVETHEAVIVNNTRQDWRFSSTVDDTFGFATHSLIGVPILREGHLLGIVQAVNKRRGNFSEADITLLQAFAQVVTQVPTRLTLPPKPDIKNASFLTWRGTEALDPARLNEL